MSYNCGTNYTVRIRIISFFFIWLWSLEHSLCICLFRSINILIFCLLSLELLILPIYTTRCMNNNYLIWQWSLYKNNEYKIFLILKLYKLIVNYHPYPCSDLSDVLYKNLNLKNCASLFFQSKKIIKLALCLRKY